MQARLHPVSVPFSHDDTLPVVADSINPAEIKGIYAHQSVSHRQGVGIVRNEEGVENTPSAGLPGSVTSTASKLIRLRNVARRGDEVRRVTGGQDGGTQRPEHQSELLSSHPHDGHDNEGRLTLFRVRFGDGSTMLIEATDKQQAAELGQTWSLRWDRFDLRRVITVIKL